MSERTKQRTIGQAMRLIAEADKHRDYRSKQLDDQLRGWVDSDGEGLALLVLLSVMSTGR